MASLVSFAGSAELDVMVIDSDSIGVEPTSDAAIVLLTDVSDARSISRLLRSGVRAILSRESDPNHVISAIYAAYDGQVMLSTASAGSLAAVYGDQPLEAETELSEEITSRETQVLRMLAEGLVNKDIATRLGISEHKQAVNKLSRLDPKTGEFKEYPIKTPNSGPHGLVADKDGNIWFTAISGGYIGKLNPKTGEIAEYRPADDTKIDPHTPVFDHEGILWFTNEETNYVGRLDPKTGKMTLTKLPTPHAVPYGIVILQNNTSFFCEFGTNKPASIDPSTMRIHEYTLPAASVDRGALRWHRMARFTIPISRAGISVFPGSPNTASSVLETEVTTWWGSIGRIFHRTRLTCCQARNVLLESYAGARRGSH